MQKAPPEINSSEDYNNVLYRLRKCIGILGLMLPTIIFGLYDKLLASISHYYYTSSSVFFIGILFSFGLILLSYKGYRTEVDEKVSDDFITSLAGIFILIAVIIPTSCCNSGDDSIKCGGIYLLGHINGIANTIHLVSAAIFIFILGWMCVYKFTRSKTEGGKKYHTLYKICGYIVWVCVGLIAIIFALDEFTSIDFDILIPGYTFILESIALYAFAVAWLVKGKISEDVKQIRKRLFNK